MYVTDIPKESVILQEGETVDYKWVDKSEFLEIFASEQYVANARDRWNDFVNEYIRN